ncbi:uncharacterized protein N7483_006554 [Penicillium malachiteum]|uniref:uncharacterized protein n=1 Tax=Penicillium malachiteum TaxID=1324776 RepID=UPI002547B0AD|nr:uncharacterized protein N7483_006554 [Penicillium malachiteum]KAJ5725197.1 hypothetical protein N7483_006554 [Penicillium malachiteum]
MSTSRLPCIPSLRKQQLHLEFASLRHAAPPGVYMTLAPGDPTLWNGVMFVRSGPYASAILRFQIRFPDIYPDLPPLVTFATDVFHPLIVPLTTYTFSTGSASDNPVSATDEERLPPGGIQSAAWVSPLVSGNSAGIRTKEATEPTPPTKEEDGSSGTPDSPAGNQESTNDPQTPSASKLPPTGQFPASRQEAPVAELLDYIRSTFDDESVLDSLPVEVAGNPGAWHAWQAHRRPSGDLRRGSPQARRPGDWHWDGIWARRAQDEIEASRSDPILFGNAARGGGDEMIRFSRLDDATLDSTKQKMESVVNVHKE